MNDKVSPFESRDLTSSFGLDESDSTEKPHYKGKDRRYHSRREHGDRRTDIRFEIDNPERRTNRGRRSDDGIDLTR